MWSSDIDKILLKKNDYKYRIFLAENLKGVSSFKNHFFKYRNKSIDENLVKKYFSFIQKNKNYLNDTKIHIVYLTTWERYQYPEWHNKVKFYDSIFEKMKFYSLKNNINLIDCREEIKKNHKDIFVFNFYTHYNKIGYNKIADCIQNYLK